ncbi:MAG: hypothetical protein KJ864_04430 [Candidatus Omnitrophica bacterium]|nr:hypothetical protein [Candidatus Omnitrophota bacterium]
MGKEERLNLRVSKEEKKQLEKDAKQEQRTISNLLLWCWKKWRDKKG